MTRLIIFLIIIFIGLNQTIGQSSPSIVSIGDTNINLKDIDLEKGLILSKSYYEQKQSDLLSKNYTLETKIYTNPAYNVYAIVADTIFVENNSIRGIHLTGIKFYTAKGELLFKKHFIQHPIFTTYLSANGQMAIIYLYNEDGETLQVYKSNGTLIKQYDNNKSMFYYGAKRNHFFICNNNILDGPNSFDMINKEGHIQEVIFPIGKFRGITFSPNENYYIALINSDQYLYNINNMLIWKLPYTYGNVNILPGDDKYIILNPATNELEIKALLNHNLIKKISEVSDNSNSFPLITYYVKDNYFYTIAKTTKEYIFNFFTLNGELVDIQTKSNKVPYYKYKVEYNSTSKTYFIR